MKNLKNTNFLDKSPLEIHKIIQGYKIIFDDDRRLPDIEYKVSALKQYEGSETDCNDWEYLMDFGNIAVILNYTED